jgi:hypothetical protein
MVGNNYDQLAAKILYKINCAGLFSALMRDQANLPGENPKWMVLDGDIDPMWIESLNTVMDDNKVDKNEQSIQS